MIEGMDPAVLSAGWARRREILERRPALGFMPNIGQARAFEPHLHRVPFISMFGGGNGVGKTTAGIIMALGLSFGREELGFFFENHAVFRWMEERVKRRGRPAQGRIICNADALLPNGQIYQGINRWFPKGRWKGQKLGKKIWTAIECDNGTTIEIKTHDQDPEAHAGPNLDFILADEPFPQKFWSETVARTREGGIIGMFMTPLDMAGWLLDLVVDAENDGSGDIVVTNASIWDNCKDIPGTRGHLSREHIERMIRQWERESPEQVDARVSGKFTHTSGSIFKIYSPEVHYIPPFPIPPTWPVYHIIDPHDARPPAIGWFAQGPRAAVAFREWPGGDYTTLKATSHTIAQVADAMREIEAPFHHQVVHRYMDPSKAEYEYPNTKKTVQKEYAEAGFHFSKADNSLEVGHKKVNELLWYDITKSVDEFNRPQLFVTHDCPNIHRALMRYGLKKKHNEGSSLATKVDQKYKDHADLVRYFALKRRPFEPVNASGTFWDSIKRGRVGA